jgi:hypothetical protein
VRSDVPEELQEDYDVLASAFPDGVADTDYLALLVVLDDGFSHRQLAALVAGFTGRNRVDVENDRAHAVSTRRPDPQRVNAVRDQLRAAGYPAGA